MNIATQQKKLNQQDTCLITLCTCCVENLMLAPKDKRTRKNLETLFIAVQKPSLNEQVKSNGVHLSRNDIT